MQYSVSEFETIYLRCFPAAFRLALSLLHDEDEARDATQEVFLKLWQTDTAVSNPVAFLIRAVRNVCLNRIAALDTRERFIRNLPLDPFDDPPDDPLDPDDRQAQVRSAVDSLLSPRQRQVVAKIYSEGLSYKQTAQDLDVSVAMVNKSIVGALKKLRSFFNSKKS